jgi:hypothetical protein
VGGQDEVGWRVGNPPQVNNLPHMGPEFELGEVVSIAGRLAGWIRLGPWVCFFGSFVWLRCALFGDQDLIRRRGCGGRMDGNQ